MRKSQNEAVLSALAAELKHRRSSLGINQEELAFRAGVHRSFIARVEVAQTQPSLSVFFDLANALECSASELVEGVDQRVRKESAASTADS
ncbi:helix-turn-helix domain-containing protein [Comamonas jiangduensis]|uniref:helix-turn-helix domain-containing protein n=1 Tax=Comamonas jiangduensis TaxID=1194168 RepID=UPI0028A917B1|nr:helix-turn-helix transcriptional regulator [Comamonas jiangduensis]